MRFGAHAFIWEADWNQDSARRVVASAAKAGLDVVEIPLLRPDQFDPAYYRALLADHGLSGTFSLGLPVEVTLPEHPAAAERFLRGALDKVAAAGGDMLTGVLYGTLGELPGRRPTEADYQAIARCLKPVARYAAGLGIQLGFEPVNRYETYLINTTGQAVALIERIGEPNVFIHLDTYHANIEETSQREAIRTAGKRIRYVHLSESHRGTPGTGTVDWDSVFSGLSEVRFDGCLVMESFVTLNPDIARATCMWRDLVPDRDEMVRTGVQFLRQKAQDYGLLQPA
jgi:D-psicose/D-tagatose/L-ribulose 3-epimerase